MSRPSPAAGPHSGVAAIVDRIPLTEAVAEIADEFRSEIAAFERLSGSSQAEIAVGVRRNLRRWFGWIATGVAPTDADFDPLRDWTRARANEGVRLEDLQRAFGLGGLLGWDLMRRNAREDESEALLDAAGLLMRYVGRVSAVVTDTYLAEREVLVSEDERRTRSLIDRLVSGAPLDGATRELAERLGVPIEAAYAPFAIVIRGQPPRRHAALAARLRRRGWRLAVTEGDRVVGLAWTPLDASDLDEGPQALLVVAPPAPRTELGEIRDDVVRLADRGRRLGLNGRIDAGEQLLETMVMRSPRHARLLRERVLSPLDGDEHEELRRTIDVLVSCRFDRAATTRELHVHRNTLGYRVRRIEELTGLDLDDPRDVAAVYLALAIGDGADGGHG